ncbi:hypothetical protein SAMD00019534_114600 [Acytostelium subglobosum LB1]|uniref:hypothetical protein n=1 Tax=Acytostelium subglobosum LB1 TaxID=1410327 RepID=UPI0006447DCB|nr:hypothetical protein SAMD00019534_114600 [Acytostelium subglobosum LB1]GAM28284.1 hypothetical protein SAMD00019534_114600 [Acytostelium subglobosum LB1]|eukprot:XP_012748918.1 hypothetical protein SAMD00019534_114600 [Acytostelium subglobosum LB1]
MIATLKIIGEVNDIITKDQSSCIAPLDGLVQPSEPMAVPKVKIALCGPTHSGKSTLINSILSIPNLMPSGAGHASGRICILRYSPTISIKFFRVAPQEGGNLPSILDCIHHETITIGNELNLETRRNFNKEMKTHLQRPDDIEDDEALFEVWASKIVMVELPSPLLETGLEIIDVPGYSVSDQASLFTIRKDFFEAYTPNGVLFCYSYNGILDFAFPDLVNSMPSDVERQSIFFVNTKASKSEIACSNGLGPLDTVPVEMMKGYIGDSLSQLKSFDLNTLWDEQNFAIVNALDFIRYPRQVENRFIFQQFTDRLTNWIAKLICRVGDTYLKSVEQECITMSNKIESLVNMANLMASKDERDKMAKESEKMMASYTLLVSESLKKFIESIPSLIKPIFMENFESNDEPKAIPLIDQIMAKSMPKVHKLINESAPANIYNHIIPKPLVESSLDYLLVRFAINKFRRGTDTEFGSILFKEVAGMINSYLDDTYFNYLNLNTTSSYTNVIDTWLLKQQVEPVIKRKLLTLKPSLSYLISQVYLQTPNMLNDLFNQSLSLYNLLYLEVLAHQCKLRLPFDLLKVDRTKVVGDGYVGSIYTGTMKGQTYLVQIVKPMEDKEVMDKLIKQVRMSNNANFIPMTLQAIFKHTDGANDDVEWILLYNQLKSFEPLLKDQISSQTKFLVTQLFQSLFVPK